jgi:hypothetical protein
MRDKLQRRGTGARRTHVRTLVALIPPRDEHPLASGAVLDAAPSKVSTAHTSPGQGPSS